MKNWTLALAIGTAVTTTAMGLSTSPAQAAQLSFTFAFQTSDNDLFNLNLTTADTLTTQNFSAYTDPNSGLTSPAYTFQGYLITSVSGTENGTNPITITRPTGWSVAAPGDVIAHSLTDNLFNPNGGFISPVLPSGAQGGKFSFGGLAFHVGGTENKDYQVFTDPTTGSNYGNYAGCPGTCVGATEVVLPTPGPVIPVPTNVPGKEYSDRFDKDQVATLDPEQNLYWDGNGGVQDTFDYSGSRAGDTDPAREVDALAHHQDALFWEVITNQSALLFSTGSTTALLPGDSRATVYNASAAYSSIGLQEQSVLSESISIPGAINFWAKPPQIDNNGVNDLDGLEVWSSLSPTSSQYPSPVDPTTDDANMYSLLGDPEINGARTSVWYYDNASVASTPYLLASQIATAINRSDIANLADIIDLDGLMVYDGGAIGTWDNSDAILFSVMPIDANGDGSITPNVNEGDVDGGEIWSWQFGQPLAQFLNHGGHLWDTAFNVRQATGAVNENIDALEAVATPEPSSFLGLLALGTLGAASTLKRKLKPSKSDENETTKVG